MTQAFHGHESISSEITRARESQARALHKHYIFMAQAQPARCTGTALALQRHCTGIARASDCTGIARAMRGHCAGLAGVLHKHYTCVTHALHMDYMRSTQCDRAISGTVQGALHAHGAGIARAFQRKAISLHYTGVFAVITCAAHMHHMRGARAVHHTCVARPAHVCACMARASHALGTPQCARITRALHAQIHVHYARISHECHMHVTCAKRAFLVHTHVFACASTTRAIHKHYIYKTHALHITSSTRPARVKQNTHAFHMR